MMSPAKYYKRETEQFLKKLIPLKNKSKYAIFNHILSFSEDIQSDLKTLSRKIDCNTRVVVLSFNYFWKPLLNLASFLGLRKPDKKEPNWLDKNDIRNIFSLVGFEEIKRGNRILLPFDLGIFSKFINRFFGQLPFINNFCLSSYQVFRKLPLEKRDYSVSIVIPARNEAGNIKNILRKIPRLSPKMEIIFVEGHSRDNTWEVLCHEIEKYKGKIKIKLFKQKGIGKADAVRLGLSKAANQLLIIFDADLSVAPKDLTKFYDAISSGKTEFANGSRLVYPLRGKAMPFLNIIGNKIFSLIFSYLLGQVVKDTLCGTKAILKENYLEIAKNRKYFGDFDPFGDYDLIFGASRLNLKITDIPIRYSERKYGKTNISRFKHGILLLIMAGIGLKKLKFI